MNKAINKAVRIIGEIEDKGNLKKYKLTLYDYYEFRHCVSELHKGGTPFVLSERLKDLLVKCGFTATEDEIGWIIK